MLYFLDIVLMLYAVTAHEKMRITAYDIKHKPRKVTLKQTTQALELTEVQMVDSGCVPTRLYTLAQVCFTSKSFHPVHVIAL